LLKRNVKKYWEEREKEPIAEESVFAFPGFGTGFLVHELGKKDWKK